MAQWVEGVVVGKRHWGGNLYSLRFDAPIAGFKAGQFARLALDIGGKRIGRPYSLVNAPGQRPLEVYFNEVPYGPLTPRLCCLEPGDRLWVAPRAAGLFTLEALPEARDLWLMATGTALGVYLSILRTISPWVRFEHVVLVHGVRSDEDLTYTGEIGGLIVRHPESFRFVSLTSRQQSAATLHGRIPAALSDGRLEREARLVLGPETSHVMLCGNPGMIQGTAAILEIRGMVRHRRGHPGHYTTEKYH
jgi:ferredoxin--NADP+ reductase